MDTMEHIHDQDLSEVRIPDVVMAVCVTNATLRTPGVAGLSSGVTDTISRTILGKESLFRGVKVNQTEDGLILDVFIDVEYGVKIPVVAWDVQTNAKKELETMTDRPVLAVNIHVQAVRAAKTEMVK